MSKVTKELVELRMRILREKAGSPTDYRIDGVIQVGYIGAEYNAVYGGWRLYCITSVGGSETSNIMGFSGRHPTACFHAMLGVAIACIGKKWDAQNGY